MPIELPARIPNSERSRRGVALPSAADVPTVRLASDPGVKLASPNINVPSGAFGGAVGQGLQELGSGIADFGASIAKVSQAAQDARRATAVKSATARATADLKAFVLDLEQDPDYQSYPDKFKARAEAALEAYGADLDDRGKAEFRSNFEAMALGQAYDARRLANKRVVDAATADLDTSLDTFAGVAAGASRPEDHDLAVAQAIGTIDDAAAGGIISAEEAGKRKRTFAGRLDEVEAMQQISADPDRAATMLVDPELFPNLDEKRRQTLLDTATRRSDALATKRRAEAERQDKLAEKRMKEDGDALLKTFYDSDSPSAAQLDALKNHPGVSPAEYKGAVKLLEGGSKEDDTGFLLDVIPRLHTEDISRDLSEGLAAGKLKSDTYRTLMNQNKAALADDRPASPYKSGRDYVSNGLDPGQLGADPFVRAALTAAQTDALVDYDTWAAAHPDATFEQSIEQARAIRSQYQNVAFDQMSLALPRPRGFAGSKRDVTIEHVNAARRDLARRIQSGDLSDTEAAREIESLNTWEGVLARKTNDQKAPK